MIDEMQIQLERLKPELEQKKRQVDATVKKLHKQSDQVEKNRVLVDKEKEEVMLQMQEADKIRNECTERLEEAMPLYEEARAALSCLKAENFTEIKNYNNPPPGVRLALEACCVMLGLKGKLVKVDNEKKMDFWEVSKKELANWKKLIEKLNTYDKDNVSPSVIANI